MVICVDILFRQDGLQRLRNIERLRRLIESSDFIFDGNRVQVTLSIGAAYYYKSDHDYQDALKRADRSVYKAKLAGRNKVCVLK